MQKQYSQKPFINSLMKVERGLCVAFNWICAIILLAMIASMAIQVLSRFVLKVSVPWTDELSRYLWVSVTYLGAGIAISDNSHVEISLIAAVVAGAKTEKTRRRWAKAIDIIRFSFLLAISCFLAYHSWIFMLQIKRINMLSAAMQIPVWWLDAMLTIGTISMAIHSLIRLIISIVDDGAIIDPVYLGKEAEQ